MEHPYQPIMCIVGDGHGVLYRDYTMGPAGVRIWECPLGLPEILTVAYIRVSSSFKA